MSVLVLAEHDNAALGRASLHAVTAAQALGGEVHLLVAGSGSAPAAEAAARVAGVARVLHVDSPACAHPLAENLAPLAVGLAEGYSHLLAAATTFGKNVMPRIAALLDVAQISDVIEIVSESVFVRPTHAGNAIATVESRDARKVVTVRATAFDAAPAETTTISSAWPASLMRTASSTAISQKGFIAIFTLAVSTPVSSDLTRTFTFASMVRLIATRTFIRLLAPGRYGNPNVFAAAP